MRGATVGEPVLGELVSFETGKPVGCCVDISLVGSGVVSFTNATGPLVGAVDGAKEVGGSVCVVGAKVGDSVTCISNGVT